MIGVLINLIKPWHILYADMYVHAVYYQCILFGQLHPKIYLTEMMVPGGKLISSICFKLMRVKEGPC